MGFQEGHLAKDIIHGDRRRQRRYPLELDLEYKIFHEGRVVASGSGRTDNISSGGLLFYAGDVDLPDGLSVDLSVRWPAVLGDAPFVELCISGRIVRNGPQGAAVRMTRHQFQKLVNLSAAFDQVYGKVLIQ